MSRRHNVGNFETINIKGSKIGKRIQDKSTRTKEQIEKKMDYVSLVSPQYPVWLSWTYQE
jgi:hypothetical protein